MTGIVNAEPDFKGHGKVINGCSDLLVEALGDRGRHACTCQGSGSLPAALTCEMIVRIKPKGGRGKVALVGALVGIAAVIYYVKSIK
mmetsp:Transcript_53958/g.126080  ORF Transcript_53958/g.126080 Transcript_53958/m.126080 type:complete len:87 (+) Transcript_53958:337-597(+)